MCMFAMFVAGVVHWGKNGNALLHENWAAGQPGSARMIAQAIFQGVCLGFLGATGCALHCSAARTTVDLILFPQVRMLVLLQARSSCP